MSTSRITDEAVEAAARSLNRNLFNDPQQADWQEVVRGTARAALEAALPHLAPVDRKALESIVLDEFAGQGGLGSRVLEEGAKSIADAVLALLNGTARCVCDVQGSALSASCKIHGSQS